MWPLLALTGLKMIGDENNRKAAAESAAITQKYSPWTGQRADWSVAMKNNGMNSLISGAGAAMLQNQMGENAANVANASDADYYSKLSADPSSVGVTPIANKSAFAAAASASPVASGASRAPAVLPGGTQEASQFDLQGAVNPYKDPTPLMLQGQVPGRENPWLSLSKSSPIMGTQNPVAPGMGLDNSVWFRR